MRRTDYRETAATLTVADCADNVRHALSLGLTEYVPAPVVHDGHFVVCGSGPSLVRFEAEIRRERERGRPICAVKGAHDWLMECGIKPNLYVCIDPQDRTNTVQRKSEKTVYMLSSRCHPAMFEHLKDCKILLWHSLRVDVDGAMTRDEILARVEPPELRAKTLIGGGSTSGMRAVFLGYTMGFRKFILYGMDSCLENGIKRFTGERPGAVVDRIVGGRTFLCNGAMALQADEFQQVYTVLPDATFDVVGDGLLAAIVAERRRLGYPA